MKYYHYVIMTEQKTTHVLRIPENTNLINHINKINPVIVHPCGSFAEAVKISEMWKKG